jgi:DNA-binding winged helix-turn-helix (wHTH) protein
MQYFNRLRTSQSPGVYHFSGFTIDVRRREITDSETHAVDLNGKNLDVLVLLIERRDRMVTSREIYEHVWQTAWDPACKNNVDRAVSDIRKALGDPSQNPSIIGREKGKGVRFIAEVECRGAELKPSAGRIRAMFIAVSVVIVMVGAWAVIRGKREPIVSSGFRVLTPNDTLKRVPLVSDGAWVYFTEQTQGVYSITQIALDGSRHERFPTSIPNPYVVAISPSKRELLVRQVVGDFNNHEAPFWIQPLNGGEAQLLETGVRGFDGVWTPLGDGLVVCHGNELLRFDLRHRVVTVLAKVPGFAWWPRWSPDGRQLRFTVQNSASDDSLWEMRADGSNLHPVFRTDAAPWAHGGCGSWSPDGSYFLFDGPSDRRGNPRDKSLWAWDEAHESSPHVIMSQIGRLRGASFVSGSDRVWVRGESLGAEPLLIDLPTGRKERFLAPHRFETASISRDGKAIAFTTAAPNDELWIGPSSGVSPRKVLGAPWQTAFPEWSPDGKQVVVDVKQLDQNWQIGLAS